jgi:hypothetical protein
LYKPPVVDQLLPWWRRIGFAVGVFFRILFDGGYASALRGKASRGAESSLPVRAPVAGGDWAPNWPVRAAEPSGGSDRGALVLLSLLQTEGRFVDFVQQDIAAFPDAEVGAVARVVHGGCRKALSAHLRIEAIRSESEGQPVALEPGFDPNRIKLTGNVAGAGRLRGVLRHRGWQASDVRLPTVVDPAAALVLCPAEVEL